MILPQKHIKMSESIFGLSAMILELIDKPTNIDNLWSEFQKANIKGDIPGHQTNFLEYRLIWIMRNEPFKYT